VADLGFVGFCCPRVLVAVMADFDRGTRPCLARVAFTAAIVSVYGFLADSPVVARNSAKRFASRLAFG
jgi:hypothetical protein